MNCEKSDLRIFEKTTVVSYSLKMMTYDAYFHTKVAAYSIWHHYKWKFYYVVAAMNQWSCHQYFCCCCTSAFSRWWHMPHTFTPRWLHTVLYSLLLFLLSQFPMSLVLYHQTFSATNNLIVCLRKNNKNNVNANYAPWDIDFSCH